MAQGLLIVWHSRTGASRAMAHAAHKGAMTELGSRLSKAEQTSPADVLGSAGYLFCFPENLGSMSGEMKAFFDRTYYPLLGQLEGRPYASIVAAGSGGHGAQLQLDRIVTGWRLRAMNHGFDDPAQAPEDILAPKTVPDKVLQACHSLGQGIAAGISLGVF
jgi:NAD(P)H-dependent FMN reductase